MKSHPKMVNGFWEGEPGVGMYIIKKGVLKIYKMSTDGKNEDLALLKDGDFFGELALLDDSPRSASAVAIEACHILGFFRPDFLASSSGSHGSVSKW